MKKSFLLVVLALFAAGASAQDDIKTDKYKVETNRFWSNWFIDASGGVQVYFGDGDSDAKFSKRLAPAVDLSLGKWFTPGLGLRFGYMGLQAKGATQYATGHHSTGELVDGKYYEQKWDMMNLHADVMFNLSNMFCGYNEKRVYSFIPFVGLSLLHSYDRPRTNEFGFTAGLVNKFRLSPALDLNIEMRGTLVKDGFDSEFGGKSKEGLAAVTLGLTYKFKQRDFKHSEPIYTGISESELRRVQNQLRDAMTYNGQLKDEIEDLRNREPEVIVKGGEEQPRVIFFNIGKSDISIRDMVNIRLTAEALKAADQNTVYTVKGYADSATGSAQYNQKLSLRRAEAVVDALVKEGVNPSMLKAQGMGGVDALFGDNNSLSRVVIVK